MSVIICEDCQAAVDTDFVEAIAVVGHDGLVCERCAEANYESCEDCGTVFDPAQHDTCPGCHDPDDRDFDVMESDDEPESRWDTDPRV